MSPSAIKIDTLAIAKELEDAGVPIQQAINTLMEDQLATKQEIVAVEQNLSKKIDNEFYS